MKTWSVPYYFIGGSKFSGGAGPLLYIITNPEKLNQQRIKLDCRISNQDKSGCVNVCSNSLYNKEENKQALCSIHYASHNPNRYGRAWWYKAGHWPFAENRLLQFEVDKTIVISYEQQKNKYFSLKRQHAYIPTIFLIFSMGLFLLLQIIELPIITKKEK